MTLGSEPGADSRQSAACRPIRRPMFGVREFPAHALGRPFAFRRSCSPRSVRDEPGAPTPSRRWCDDAFRLRDRSDITVGSLEPLWNATHVAHVVAAESWSSDGSHATSPTSIRYAVPKSPFSARSTLGSGFFFVRRGPRAPLSAPLSRSDVPRRSAGASSSSHNSGTDSRERRRLGASRPSSRGRRRAGHRLGLHRRQGVAVAVEGDRDLLVTQHLGHDLRVRAGDQLQRREGVAQFVEADRRAARPGAAAP